MKETMQKSQIEMESSREYTGTYIANFKDLGLGKPDGVPTKYAGASKELLQEVAEHHAEKLVPVTDIDATGCIDGRKTLSNADESMPQKRLRRVGGSASNYGVALNAGASIVDTLSPDSSLGEQVNAVDEEVSQLTGFERSAHQGGCGGANGEIADHEAISTNPAILAATKTFMEIPAVKAYFEVGYSDELGEKVRENAAKTAELLKAEAWNGQTYVDGVTKENPGKVEILQVDPNDEKFHGHKENTLTVVIGDETLDMDDEFVWNLKASKKVAKALAGERGVEGYQQALISEVAKHISVGNRLCNEDTPIIIVASKAA
jgi:hypothetical protein